MQPIVSCRTVAAKTQPTRCLGTRNPVKIIPYTLTQTLARTIHHRCLAMKLFFRSQAKAKLH